MTALSQQTAGGRASFSANHPTGSYDAPLCPKDLGRENTRTNRAHAYLTKPLFSQN